MNTEEIGRIYDSLCRQADEVLEKINPCRRTGVDCTFGKEGVIFCCQGCKHLGPSGCTEKSLTCKLWLCGKSREKFPLAQLALEAIAKKAARIGFYQVLRGSRDDHIKNVGKLDHRENAFFYCIEPPFSV